MSTGPACAKTPSRKPYALYAALVVVTLILAIYAFRKTDTQRTGLPANGAHPAATAWRRQQVGALSLECPLELTRDEKSADRLTPEARSLLQDIEIHTSGERGSGLQLSVSHITYQPGVELTLEGAATSALAQAATQSSDPDPKFQVTPTSLKDFSAVRGSYRPRKWGQGIAMDLLVIRNGQQLWQLQVVSTDPSYLPEMDRIFASVALAETPANPLPEKSEGLTGK